MWLHNWHFFANRSHLRNHPERLVGQEAVQQYAWHGTLAHYLIKLKGGDDQYQLAIGNNLARHFPIQVDTGHGFGGLPRGLLGSFWGYTLKAIRVLLGVWISM